MPRFRWSPRRWLAFLPPRLDEAPPRLHSRQQPRSGRPSAVPIGVFTSRTPRASKAAMQAHLARRFLGFLGPVSGVFPGESEWRGWPNLIFNRWTKKVIAPGTGRQLSPKIYRRVKEFGARIGNLVAIPIPPKIPPVRDWVVAPGANTDRASGFPQPLALFLIFPLEAGEASPGVIYPQEGVYS